MDMDIFVGLKGPPNGKKTIYGWTPNSASYDLWIGTSGGNLTRAGTGNLFKGGLSCKKVQGIFRFIYDTNLSLTKTIRFQLNRDRTEKDPIDEDK